MPESDSPQNAFFVFALQQALYIMTPMAACAPIIIYLFCQKEMMQEAASRRFLSRFFFTEREWFHLALFHRTTASRSGVSTGGRLYRVMSSTRFGSSDLQGVLPRSLLSICLCRVHCDLCKLEKSPRNQAPRSAAE